MIGEHVIAEVHLGTSQTSMMKITLHKKLITLHKKLVTFTEEILNGKLHFLRSVSDWNPLVIFSKKYHLDDLWQDPKYVFVLYNFIKYRIFT